MYTLDPRLRRIVYVLVFEVLAIALSTAILAGLSHGPVAEAAPVAVAVSIIAVAWNYLFNSLFETVERRLNLAKRTIGLRVIHSGGFELGLFLFTVPLYMLWYQVGFIEAVTMEAVLLAFFLIYTFAFTWAFDQIFALNHPCKDLAAVQH